MVLKSLNSLARQAAQKFTLRDVLIIPFAVQLFAIVSLVGYLSHKKGQNAVKQIASQLLCEVTERVGQNLHSYLEIPHKINQINQVAINLNQLNLEDKQKLKDYFLGQIKIFNNLTFIGLGLENKDNLGIERFEDGTLALRISTKASNHVFNTYRLNQFGEPVKLLDSIEFDPRTRPWYRAAVAAQKPIWSDIYPNTAGLTAYLGASMPFYDEENQLQGVLLINMNLSQIGDFLENLKIGQTGQAFIIDRTGLLVSTSTGEQPYITTNEIYGAKRFKATESSNQLTKEIAKYIEKEIATDPNKQRSQHFELEIKGKKIFIQLRPFQDRFGLDWTIVVALPQSDFTQEIEANSRMTIALCLIALIIAIIFGFLTSNWIIKPILNLNKAAKSLASGEWQQKVKIDRFDELGELAQSFNYMAKQLQESFEILETKNLQLERLDKLKDEFLANTSHELRTPLNGIIGIAESLLDGVTGRLPQATCSNLEMIAISGRRLNNLINDILDFSKLKHNTIELQLEPLGVREIAEIVVMLTQPLLQQKDLQLINAIPQDFPLVDGNENRLEQIFYNLVGNAIKFTDRGRVEISATVAGDYAAISVSDTGIGIPEDKLERIFESFEQVEGFTARNYEGTGLGLAITKKLVELHGGQITVKSTLEEGSQFTFTLPISKESPTEPLQVKQPSPASVKTRNTSDRYLPNRDRIIDKIGSTLGTNQLDEDNAKNWQILIVDDDPVNRQVLFNYLSLCNYTIVQASSGEETLELLENGVKPNLILLDIMMPKMTGYEVIEQIRLNWQLDELPILLLSAKNRPFDIVTGLRSGANDYLSKPFAKEELIARIKTHLNLAQQIIERQQAELVLCETQNKLAQFLEALPVGIFITTGVGKPYYLNQIAKQILGKGLVTSISVEGLAQTYNLYVANSNRFYPSEKNPIYKALKGEKTYTPDMEIRSPDPDGETIPLDIWTTPIAREDGEIEYIISAFQDISDRKRLEEENLLLQQVSEDLSYSYQIGGGLAANASSYVVRDSDRQLYQEILQAKFCYVFNARQMGKSSLRNKTISQLKQKGYHCGVIDLTEIGSSNLNEEQWYASLIFNLAKSLSIAQFSDKFNFAQWWKSLNPISAISKFREFISEIILKNIDSKIVIFIDEIDSIRRLSFAPNDFLALIRFLYDARPQNSDLNRLTFVLLGAANPYSLLFSSQESTPFNIGTPISLEGFKIHEIQPLAKGLEQLCDDGKTVLQAILAWTGGQPFLTQKICYFIKKSRQNIPAGSEIKAINTLVREKIITNWKKQDNPAHFQVIEQNILNSPNKFNLLKIYRQILQGKLIPADNSDEQMELILSGLVCSQAGYLQVFNQIYASIFNLGWLEENLD